MPQIPESPRRSAAGGGSGSNPLKSDLILIQLMEELDTVSSHDGFQNWRTNFLNRFESFLGDDASRNNAQNAYETFRHDRMQHVVKKVDRVNNFVQKGDLSLNRVSVKARNAMNELSVYLLDTIKDVRGLAPPTSAEEAKAGFTKYHLGAVLVRDGFQEYERLQQCKDILDHLKEECIEAIGDEKMLDAIRKYDDEINRFVALMEDLGLYKIMLKNRQFDPNEKEKTKRTKEEETPPDKNTLPSGIPPIPFSDSNDSSLPDEASASASNNETSETTTATTATTTTTTTTTEQITNNTSPTPDSAPSTPKKKKNIPSSAPSTPKGSGRDNYNVKGSWGSLRDFGGGDASSPTKTGKVRAPSPSNRRNPDKVFVTPMRDPKKMSSSADSSKSMGSLPNLDDNTSERSSVVGPGGGKPPKPVIGDASSSTRILDTDTPRTRKAKLEWMSVQGVPKIPETGKAKRRGSASSVASASSSSSSKKKSSSGKKLSTSPKNKPPRPPMGDTKELVTKTQDKGWNMQLDPNANPDEVWCRAREPTKHEKDGDNTTTTTTTTTNKTTTTKTTTSTTDEDSKDDDDNNNNTVKSVAVSSPTNNNNNTNESSSQEEESKIIENETTTTTTTTTTTKTTTTDENEIQNEKQQQQVQQKTADALNSVEKNTKTTTTEEYHKGAGGIVVTGNTTAAPVVVMKSIPKQVSEQTIENNNNSDSTTTIVKNTKVHHLIETNVTTNTTTRQSGAEWIGTFKAVEGREVHSAGRMYVAGSGMRRASSIRYLTFCSIDDSIDPKLLGIIGRCYPLVEFAVLLRPDMAGQPRYASTKWLQRLATVQANTKNLMKLAAHLCGSLVNEVLSGDDAILKRLTEMKFQRVQLNATAINGVNTHDIGKYVHSFLTVAENNPDLEIIIQRNKETRPLWEGVLSSGQLLPSNVSMLFDESKGMGIMPDDLKWPRAPKDLKVGYAGGIGLGGRSMFKKTIKDILAVGNGQEVWISMESSMRCTKNGKDIFDINKCYEIMDVATECNVHLHPGFIA